MDNIRRASVVICGAGIAGISTAYYLSVKNGMRDILLIDEGPPLNLTSNKSTEAYRNWWPGPDNAMISLMNRSIDLMEELANESGNVFHLNRRGYLYCCGSLESAKNLRQTAEAVASLGAGPLRIRTADQITSDYSLSPAEGFNGQPTGADLLIGSEVIKKHFPYLSESIVAALHVRRAGWFSAHQMGMYMLEQARERGVRILQARLVGVETQNGKVTAVRLQDGSRIVTSALVNAAGPFLPKIGRMMGIELPVYHELHMKIAFRDHLSVIHRDAPLLIWDEPQTLSWDKDEQEILANDPELIYLLAELPAGVHSRPEGGNDSQMILILWNYHNRKMDPIFPIPEDTILPEVALRGLARMIPGMNVYLKHLARPIVDGGYYTKTRENRPLIGKLPVKGAFVIGALSGFGLMAACAAGDLLSAYLLESALPDYAPAFSLERYSDDAYLHRWDNWQETAQL